MNFQSIIAILLISPSVVLTSFIFGAVFDKPLDSADRPFVANGFEKSPRRLNQLIPTTDPQPPIEAAKQTPTQLHPPIAGPNSDFSPYSITANLDSAPAPNVSVQANLNRANPIQVNPIQANSIHENRLQNIPLHVKSGYEIPERAELIPQTQLPNLNDDADTAHLAAGSNVSRRQTLNQSGHSISEVQQKSKSALEQHFSTGRSKHIQNRFANSEDQSTLAARVLALERNLTTGHADESSQGLTAVQRATYESKITGPATSVLINEPTLSGSENTGLSRQIAPRNGMMGMSVQQPVLQRLQVNPQVEARAREHIEYGESLARRNSYLAAREEFTLALLLIARSHKAQYDPDAYSNRLSQGLTALDEAADLVGPNHGLSQQGMLQQKVLSHKTKLIAPNEIGNISRTKVLDRYCGFAQSQIEVAIGHSAAGSTALHTLGKIETRSSINNRRGDWTGQARALVFFRAAMSCNPANAVCANDLGVLLNDMGRLKEAEQVLKVSLTSSPTRSAWANLSAVHSQLALNAKVVQERDRQMHLAKLAAMRAEESGYSVTANGGAGEQWASMREFHNNAAFPSVTTQVVPRSGQQTSNQRDASTAKTLMQKVKGWY